MESADAPEIDFDHLNTFVQGDESLTREIFSLFKNQVDLWSKNLQADAPDEIWSAMSHSLKGTANAVGALRLAELCKQAEAQVGETRRPGAREVLIEKIETVMSRVNIEMQRWEYRQSMQALKADSPWPTK